MSSKLRHKLKSYFKTRDTSESAVELMRMFIFPFHRAWNPEASVDDAINAFFGSEQRKFFHGKAKRDFKIPGALYVTGTRTTIRVKEREIKEGQLLLLSIDKREQSARIEIIEQRRIFLLSRAELEYVKNYIEVKEA